MATGKNSSYLKKKEKTHGFEVLVGDQKPTTTSSSNGRKRKRISEAQIRPWSDLPADLVGELLAGLSSTDQIRFGAACRNFLSSIPRHNSSHGNGDHNQVFDRLPWLVKYSTDECFIKCEMYGPRRPRTPYVVYSITNKDVEISKYYGTRLLACKHDWMFLTWLDHNKQKDVTNDQTNGKISFMLFSPFTKQIVALPDLDRTNILGIKPKRDVGAFSSHPSSPDCVYFVLNRVFPEVIISTCRKGDRDWSVQVFDCPAFWWFKSAVYYEGSFYVVSDNGKLAAYDVAQRDWKYIISSKPFFMNEVRVGNLLVHDGKLLLKCEDGAHVKKKDECNVILFSRSTSSWIKQTSLGDYALFLGCRSAFSHSADTSCSSRMRDIADKIFYYKYPGGKQKCQCYSLKDGKLDNSIYSCLPHIFYDESAVWIEPPHCMPARATFH